jgi:hypothetical protein
VSDTDPHSVSYGTDTGISLMPIEIRIRQKDANIHGSRSGNAIQSDKNLHCFWPRHGLWLHQPNSVAHPWLSIDPRLQ